MAKSRQRDSQWQSKEDQKSLSQQQRNKSDGKKDADQPDRIAGIFDKKEHDGATHFSA